MEQVVPLPSNDSAATAAIRHREMGGLCRLAAIKVQSERIVITRWGGGMFRIALWASGRAAGEGGEEGKDGVRVYHVDRIAKRPRLTSLHNSPPLQLGTSQ
jgi:hypothetical protein